MSFLYFIKKLNKKKEKAKTCRIYVMLSNWRTNLQNKGYPTDFIEQLKEKCDIVSTVSKYVQLNKKGKTYWGCCPFHFEKTPSFAVNEMEQYYHCFGCGESGDVIKFIQKIESLDFMNAVKHLAKDAGLELPEWTGDEKVIEQNKIKERMYQANNLALSHYRENLKLPQAKVALEYMQKRGLDKDIAEKFGIGYSNGWTSLVDFLKQNKVSVSTMEQAGLCDTKNGRTFDVMATRLMFPIVNVYGDCIGFTARQLEDGNFAKYRNTKETVIFDKSKTVYNINNIKRIKQERGLDYILIGEGAMDVIALSKAGFENSGACMGTAITPYHAKLLKRFANKIVLCLDGDSAGQKASFRAIDILMDDGLDVRVVTLPENLDPDEFLKKYGKEKLAEYIENAVVGLDFKLITLSKRYNLNNNYEKSKFVTEAFEVLKILKTISEKEVYLKLISRLTNINIDSLKRDLLNFDSGGTQKPQNDIIQKSEEFREDSNQKAIKFLLASLLYKKDYAKFDNTIYFKNPSYQKLFDYMMECNQNDKVYTVSSIFDMFEVDENNDIKQIINFNFNEFLGKEEIYFKQSLARIRNTGLQLEIERLTQAFKQETDLTKRREIASKLSLVTKELKNNKNGD